MKTKICILILLLFSFSSSLLSQTAFELISKGDNLYSEMQDLDAAEKALNYYRDAQGKLENQFDAYWRISRILYYKGSHTEGKKEKKKIFSLAVYYATKAIEAEPEKPDGYFWQAVNNGKTGEVRGILKSLSLVKPIKKALNKVIELDRGYEDGGADRVLGRVYFKLPGFAGGSKKKSLDHLIKSKEFGPEDAMTRLYLAETLLAKKEKEKAKAELEYILNMKDDPRWVSGISENKILAKKLLDKKFK